MDRIEVDQVVDLDEDHVVEVVDYGLGKKPYALRKSWQEFHEGMKTRGSVIHIVGAAERPGIDIWAHQLETKYYWPPGSPMNALLSVHATLWFDQRWHVVTIPAKHERFAVKVGKAVGLAVRETVPWGKDEGPIITLGSFGKTTPPPGGKWFPLRGGNVRTLEYLPGGELSRAARSGLGPILKEMEAEIVRRSEPRPRTDAN